MACFFTESSRATKDWVLLSRAVMIGIRVAAFRLKVLGIRASRSWEMEAAEVEDILMVVASGAEKKIHGDAR